MPSIVLCFFLLVFAMVIYGVAMVFAINHFRDADLPHPLFTLGFITIACVIAFGLVAGQAIHVSEPRGAYVPLLSTIATALVLCGVMRLAGLVGHRLRLQYVSRCVIFAGLSLLPLALDAYACAIRNPPLIQ